MQFRLRLTTLGSLKTGRLVILLALGVGLVTVLAVGYHKLVRWKKFAVVVPGQLIRSGQLRDYQLAAAIERHNIKTVYSFTFTDNDREQAVCDRLGVARHFHYLPGDGVGADEPYLEFLRVASQAGNQPVLVHCSAGVQRTGGAVALYRVLIEGWDFDDAIAEMIAMGNEGLEPQINQLRRIAHRHRSRSLNRTPIYGKSATTQSETTR